jgi:hypothetical protein
VALCCSPSPFHPFAVAAGTHPWSLVMARRLQADHGIGTLDWESRAHRIVELIRTPAGVGQVATELDAMDEGSEGMPEGFGSELDALAISRQAGDEASACGFAELAALRVDRKAQHA